MSARISRLSGWLGETDLYAYNPRNRDLWVEARSGEVISGARVLDAGAGSAPYRHLFAHCDYQTQDFSALKSEQLRDGGYGQIDYVCDIATIPVAAASFDVVLCTEVLEHVPEPIKVVAEFARVLKPGGLLLLTAPLGSGIHQEPFHFYGGYTPYWYERFLAATGFEAITVEPNCGSSRHFGQEAVRFLRMTMPFRAPLPMIASAIWLPFWLLLTPILGVLIPITVTLLDRYDVERRFTVGYHVTARRSGARTP